MYISPISSFRFVCVVASIVVLASGAVHTQTTFRDLSVSKLVYPAPGYFFISPNCMDSISAMDHSGKNVFKHYSGQNANLLPFEGKWATHFSAGSGKTFFVRRDVHFDPMDTLRATAPLLTDFHECRILTDTSYIILGIEERIIDLSGVVSNGKKDAIVWVNVIQERTFKGVTLFQWKSIDHIPVTDATEDIDLTNPLIDYIHINSIWKDNDGNYLVSCRHLDEIIKINRTNGSVMWRMGGSKSKNNQFRFLNDTTEGFVGFSHQHTATRTSAGTILMMDNGNLKEAPQTSRAVEYEVDEIAKTAKRVWQFSPKPTQYASTMGSATELENGNILVGWGSGSNNTIAHEVGRDGTIHVQIDNPTANGFASYRVIKAVFAMTGVFQRISSTGTTDFKRADSSTHVSISWSRVDDTTSAVVERHSYAPHNISFGSDVGCGVIPTRWVVRFEHPTLVAGTMSFDIGNTPGVLYPNRIQLYSRPAEGKGEFTLVTTSYNASTKQLNANKLTAGEFMIAYALCFAPSIVSPPNNATEVASSPSLQWSEAVSSGQYQVEIANDPSFQTVQTRLTVSKLDTTVGPYPDFSTLYWRVRAKRTTDYGVWSNLAKFTTTLGIPKIITPIAKADTFAVLPNQEFRWSSATGAQWYRAVIVPVGSTTPSVDTVVGELSFVANKKLSANTRFTWTVRAIYDTLQGRESVPAFFITAPTAPGLLAPLFEAQNVPTSGAEFTWTAVPGAISYVVTVRRLSDSLILGVDSSSSSPGRINSLPQATRAFWTCRAVGKYGPGLDAKPFYTLTTGSGAFLRAPMTITPKLVGGVDTQNVVFTWSSVPLATLYDLEVALDQSFVSPKIAVFRLTEPTWTASGLEPGVPYMWRVLGYADSANGTWSDTASFTTVTRPDQGLTPLTPLSGSVNVPVEGTCTYSVSSQFDSYEVQLSKDPTFQLVALIFNSSSEAAAYEGLEVNSRYFWRVLGKKLGLNAEYGPVAQFATSSTTGVSAASASICNEIEASLRDGTLRIRLRCPAVTPLKASVYSMRGNIVGTMFVGASEFESSSYLGSLSAGLYTVTIADGYSMIKTLSVLVLQ